MGGNSGGQNTTVTKSDPWAGQQPYLKQGFADAQRNYYSNTPSYYQGSTVAPQSNTTKAAYNQLERGVTNNPLQNSATALTQNTLNGKYLYGNPYLDAQFTAGTHNIANSYNDIVNGQTANFSGAGRYGSGMQAIMQDRANQTLGQNLDDLYANTYGQNYQQERQNQVNAVGQGINLQNQGITNANALGDVGTAKDQYAQSLRDADIERWNYNQNLPTNKLAQYLGLIQGNYGGSSATTTPTSSNQWGNILGAGALGLGAFSSAIR